MWYNRDMNRLVGFLVSGVFGIAAIGAVNSGTSYNAEKNRNDDVNIVEAPKTPEITTKIVEVKEVIAYETVTQEDSSLSKGSTRIITEGVNGERIRTYEVTYEDGIEKSRKFISSEVTKQPVNKVVANGTYVAPTYNYKTCSNGTYINSKGNEVCRPSYDNNGGATAICNDGTYSYSQSRSGTCSHHGGVRTWL